MHAVSYERLRNQPQRTQRKSEKTPVTDRIRSGILWRYSSSLCSMFSVANYLNLVAALLLLPSLPHLEVPPREIQERPPIRDGCRVAAVVVDPAEIAGD